MSPSKLNEQSKDDANEYVNAIMNTHQAECVKGQCTPISRKRHLSLPNDIEPDISVKKVCSEKEKSSETSGRVLAQARRSLYGSTPAGKGNGPISSVPTTTNQSVISGDELDKVNSDNCGEVIKPDTEREDNNKLITMLTEISSDIKVMKGRIDTLESNLNSKHQILSDRLQEMESRLERKLSDKMAQLMDKRLSSEFKRIRNEIDGRLCDNKSETDEEIRQLCEKFDKLQENGQSNGENGSEIRNLALNVVIRDLPEHSGENTLAKVNNMIRDNMKLNDVKAESAERKHSHNAKPGVVIAKFESLDDKKRIMEAKSKLRNTVYSKVYINNDQTKEERLYNNNLRMLVKAINSGSTNVSVRGSRVMQNGVHSSTGQEQNTRANTSNQQSQFRGPPNRNGSQSYSQQNGNGHRSLFGSNRNGRGGARGYSQNNNRRH